MKEELTQKQKQFCLEYLKDFNATQAYKKVYGVSDETASANGSRLLANAKVQEYLGSKVEKKMDKAEVGVDYVLKNLKEIVEIGMGRQSVKLNGEEKEVFDLKNANSALEKLGKYNSMYTDKIQQEGNISIEIISYKDYPDD